MLESFVQADRPAGDNRTRSQQLGDALVQLADNALASGSLPLLRTVKPHVTVLIDLDDLADPATGPGAARTGFGAQISAARARWLACDSNISRIVMGPDGQILDHGRTRRIVPPGLRRAVEVQQHHCVFAGCEAPSHWCDVALPEFRGRLGDQFGVGGGCAVAEGGVESVVVVVPDVVEEAAARFGAGLDDPAGVDVLVFQ
jgi:hypothetical protein